MRPGKLKLSTPDWYKTILPTGATLRGVIECMNVSSLRIALIVNERNELVGTITDGDIRTVLLQGLTLDASIEKVIHREALVVPSNMEQHVVLQLMAKNRIQQIPVVDEQQRVIGLHVWDELTTPAVRSNLMVIMAGGKGARLQPFTDNCPKPLVTVAGKPMLEHVIERAKREGFSDFILAVHHLGNMIEEYFGDGDKLDVNINYLREETPLGTAGALSFLTPRPKEPLVVTNGDVVTDIRYGDLLDFHNRYAAAATMAVRSYEWQHPFGVVHTQGMDIVGLEEKPVVRTNINAGVYVLSPDSLGKLKQGAVCDMPMLFERLQACNLRTVAYPMHEPWLDVGRPDDLEKARSAARSVPSSFLDV